MVQVCVPTGFFMAAFVEEEIRLVQLILWNTGKVKLPPRPGRELSVQIWEAAAKASRMALTMVAGPAQSPMQKSLAPLS